MHSTVRAGADILLEYGPDTGLLIRTEAEATPSWANESFVGLLVG